MSKADEAHLDRVASLGCVACLKDGTPGTPAHAHHIRTGQGGGQRSSDWLTIPLCPEHHQHGKCSVHGGPKLFAMRYGSELDLLADVLRRVYG